MYNVQTPVIGNGKLLGFGSSNTPKNLIMHTLLEEQIKYLSEDVKDGMRTGSLRAVASTLVAMRLTGVTDVVRFTDSSETEKVGVRSFRNQMLSKDRPFIVTGIQILAAELPAVVANQNPDIRLTRGNYQTIDVAPEHAALRSGFLSIHVNNKAEIENLSMSNFETAHMTTQPKGLFKLPDLFVLPDQVIINPVITLVDGSGTLTLTSNTAVKLIFHGFAITA